MGVERPAKTISSLSMGRQELASALHTSHRVTIASQAAVKPSGFVIEVHQSCSARIDKDVGSDPFKCNGLMLPPGISSFLILTRGNASLGQIGLRTPCNNLLFTERFVPMRVKHETFPWKANVMS